MITSKEILERTGLKTPQTLTSWRKDGLIPPPRITKHPSGKGTIAVWPDEVMERCVQLAKLRRPGRPSREARATVYTFNVVETHKLDTRIRRAAAIAALGDLPEFFMAMLMPHMIRHFPSNNTRSAVVAMIRERGIAGHALELLSSGYNPVLVIDEDGPKVSPDFMVSHRLAADALADCPLIVIPLLAPLKKALQAAGLSFPEVRLAAPAQCIQVPSDSESAHRTLTIAADGSFKVDIPPGP